MAREFVFIPDGHILYDPGNGILSRIFPGAGVSPENIWTPFQMDDAGNLRVSGIVLPSSSTAVLTAPSASVTSIQILSANPNRKGVIFYNDSSSVCYISYSATSSSSLFTEYLEPGATFSMDLPIYTGIVSAIWQSAVGSLKVTEMS